VCVQSLMLYSASSMIAGGLNWRLAIGALVLGNAIMGAVITINGRIGARVSTRYHVKILMVQLTLFSYTLRSQSSLVCHLDTTLVTSL
jgi:cytosine/uracil/thiamine/allantoin permease